MNLVLGALLCLAGLGNVFTQSGNSGSYGSFDLPLKLGQSTQLENKTSKECQLALMALFKEYANGNDWAVNMVDSSAKPQSGMLGGSMTWTGSFKQCVDIRSDDSLGKYCLLTMDASDLSTYFDFPKILKEQLMMNSENNTVFARVGICVPSACTESDIMHSLESIGEHKTGAIGASCYIKKPWEFTRKMKIFSIAFLCFLIPAFVAGCLELKVWGKVSCVLNKPKPEQPDKDSNENETPEEKVEPKVQIQPEGLFCKVLRTFSIQKNFNRILDQGSDRTIGCLSGLRTLSIVWIVLTHTATFIPPHMFNSPAIKIKLSSSFLYSFFSVNFYAVDTFLFLSGFLMTYNAMHRIQAKGGELGIFRYILLRWWRITPVYVMIQAGTYIFFRSLIKGPFADEIIGKFGDCDTTMWMNVIYINNFIMDENTCIAHGWYLGCDFQLFILGVLILKCFFWSGTLGKVLGGLVLLASCVVPAVLTAVYKIIPYPTTGAGSLEYYTKLYMPFYTRMTPFFCAMVLAYILIHKKEVCVKNVKVMVIGWTAAVVASAALLFGAPLLFQHFDSEIYAVTFAAASKLIWSCVIGWVVYACVTNNGGPVNWFLSLRMFQVMSKTAFCLYLIHPFVIYVAMGKIHSPVDFSHYAEAEFFLAVLAISSLLAFGLAVLVEIPLGTIPRILGFEGISARPSQEEPGQALVVIRREEETPAEPEGKTNNNYIKS